MNWLCCIIGPSDIKHTFAWICKAEWSVQTGIPDMRRCPREHFWGLQHPPWEEKHVRKAVRTRESDKGGQAGSKWNTSNSPCARLNLLPFAALAAWSPFPFQQLEPSFHFSFFLFFFFNIYLFIWLCRTLVVVRGIFRCSMQALHCSARASV